MKKAFFSMFIVLLMISSAMAAPTAWMDISNTQTGGDEIADTIYSLAPGGNFWVNIYISSLPEVFSMGFDLKYDNAQLNILQANAGVDWVFQPLADFSSPGVVHFGGGAPLGESISSTITTPNIFLASVQFNCVAPGESTLELAESSINGVGFYSSTDFSDISATIEWQNAVISQVPIPATALLFLSGIFGLVGIKRFKGRKLEG